MNWRFSDLDQDGDLDMLGVAFTGDDLIWYENDDAETFTSREIAVDTVGAAHSVSVADLNGDDFLDIVVAAQNDAAVYWFENDGAENFTQRIVDSGLATVRISDVGDIDGDGDIDVVLCGTGCQPDCLARERRSREISPASLSERLPRSTVSSLRTLMAMVIWTSPLPNSGENMVKVFLNNDDANGSDLSFSETSRVRSWRRRPLQHRRRRYRW